MSRISAKVIFCGWSIPNDLTAPYQSTNGRWPSGAYGTSPPRLPILETKEAAN
jgi:hypothetical protein